MSNRSIRMQHREKVKMIVQKIFFFFFLKSFNLLVLGTLLPKKLSRFYCDLTISLIDQCKSTTVHVDSELPEQEDPLRA